MFLDGVDTSRCRSGGMSVSNVLIEEYSQPQQVSATTGWIGLWVDGFVAFPMPGSGCSDNWPRVARGGEDEPIWDCRLIDIFQTALDCCCLSPTAPHPRRHPDKFAVVTALNRHEHPESIWLRCSNDGHPRRQTFSDTVSSLMWPYMPFQHISIALLVLGPRAFLYHQTSKQDPGFQARRTCLHTRCGGLPASNYLPDTPGSVGKSSSENYSNLPLRAGGRCGNEHSRCPCTDSISACCKAASLESCHNFLRSSQWSTSLWHWKHQPTYG